MNWAVSYSDREEVSQGFEIGQIWILERFQGAVKVSLGNGTDLRLIQW